MSFFFSVNDRKQKSTKDWPQKSTNLVHMRAMANKNGISFFFPKIMKVAKKTEYFLVKKEIKI